MRIRLLLLSILISGVSCFSQLNLGLEAQYYFNNGNANADVGGINGIVNNATLTTDRFGCPDAAYNFDPAQTPSISLGDSFDSFISGPDAQFSFSFWFNAHGNTNGGAPMLVKYGYFPCSEDERQFGAEINLAGYYSFYFASTLNGNSYMVVQGNTIVNDTNWHHVVIVYDGTIDSNNGIDRVQMYIDNQHQIITEEASLGSTSEIQDGSAYTGIGGVLSSSGADCAGLMERYNGDLDDFRLYSKLLSVQEIDSLYNEISGCVLNIETNENDLIQLFPNPTWNELNLSLSDNSLGYLSYRILDLTGKVILNGTIESSTTMISVAELNAGMYILEVLSGNDIHERIRFEKIN